MSTFSYLVDDEPAFLVDDTGAYLITDGDPFMPNYCTLQFVTVDQAGYPDPGVLVTWEIVNPDHDLVVQSATSSSDPVTAYWTLNVRVPTGSNTTTVRITRPNCGDPYNVVLNSSSSGTITVAP